MSYLDVGTCHQAIQIRVRILSGLPLSFALHIDVVRQPSSLRWLQLLGTRVISWQVPGGLTITIESVDQSDTDFHLAWDVLGPHVTALLLNLGGRLFLDGGPLVRLIDFVTLSPLC